MATYTDHRQPDEYAVFDYIYGILHCQADITRYAEFINSDFPRIPCPSSTEEFWHVSTIGTRLRERHLMVPEAVHAGVDRFLFLPPESQEQNTTSRTCPNFSERRVWINQTHYLDNVTEEIWNELIGSYQPACKWLVDSRGRKPTYDDVSHYQKILWTLQETRRIRGEIHIHIS